MVNATGLPGPLPLRSLAPTRPASRPAAEASPAGLPAPVATETVSLSTSWAPPSTAAAAAPPPNPPPYEPPAGTGGPLLMEVPDQEAYLKARDREWQVSKFNRVFGEAAWSVRDHWGNTNYWASRLEGREVAFYAPDEQGDLTLHRGVASRSPEASSTSSLFSLEGQSETFNTNTLATLAVAPPEIPAAQAPGAGFDWRYGEAGWKLRQGQFDNDFWLSSIQGREIAFSGTNDSGEAYECRGKLEQLGGPLSARFGLAGQPGEWNFYAVDKMALRPQQPPL